MAKTDFIEDTGWVPTGPASKYTEQPDSEPVFSTAAVGEEDGSSEPISSEPPPLGGGEPEFTTLALGEEDGGLFPEVGEPIVDLGGSQLDEISALFERIESALSDFPFPLGGPATDPIVTDVLYGGPETIDLGDGTDPDPIENPTIGEAALEPTSELPLYEQPLGEQPLGI